MSEAEGFLQLLCDVFGLDFNRAYTVFFQEPYFDLQRKWAIFQGTEMVSVLTTTPLTFGWGEAIGIAGVATREKYRREGYAARLLESVLRHHERGGVASSILFAQRTDLYASLGFETIDRVVRAPLSPALLDGHSSGEFDVLEPETVRAIYDRWADSHPDRLRRDDLRWRYWNWSYRIAEPVGDGYTVIEPNLLREGLYHRATPTLPLPANSEWLGTTFMADQLGLVFERAVVELYLMGKNVPGIPQMFMTDQF